MITVERSTLAAAMKLATATVESRTAIPILSHVKLTANGALAIEGTDLDTYVRASIDYEGDECEMTLPDPRRLMAALGHGGGDAVTLTPRGAGEGKREGVDIESGAFSASVSALPADEFPSHGHMVEQVFGCTIGALTLAHLARVMPAVSTEQTRYYLNGIHVHRVADWTYRFVATDGRRLMMVDVPLPDAVGNLPASFIIPRPFVSLLLANLSRAEESIAMTVGLWGFSNEPPATLDTPRRGMPRARFSTQIGDVEITMQTKLIDGTYPDYLRVVPTALTHGARCQRKDLSRALRALTPIAGACKIRAVKLTFSPDAIHLELNGISLGDARYSLPAQCRMPDGAVVGMNAQYLLDILGSLRGDEVELAFNEFGKGQYSDPLQITDPADTAFKAILMPMRV